MTQGTGFIFPLVQPPKGTLQVGQGRAWIARRTATPVNRRAGVPRTITINLNAHRNQARAHATHTLHSEIGADLSKFETVTHFVSRPSLCPDNRLSAGKPLVTHTRKISKPRRTSCAWPPTPTAAATPSSATCSATRASAWAQPMPPRYRPHIPAGDFGASLYGSGGESRVERARARVSGRRIGEVAA